MNESTDNRLRLIERTNPVVKEYLRSLSEENRRVVVRAMESLAESCCGDCAIPVGAVAPDFTASDCAGECFTLSEEVIKAPVVLSFYRGGWCPICELELEALQEIADEIHARNACLLAVSPECPKQIRQTAKGHQLTFPLLHDHGNAIARSYGVVMQLCESMRPLYAEAGLDIPKWNEDDSYELPLPATYIIDQDRVVHTAYVAKDFTKRMEPADILAALDTLNPNAES